MQQRLALHKYLVAPVPNKKRIPNQGSSKQAIRRNYHVKAMLGLSAYLAPSLYLNNISQAAWATNRHFAD